MTGRQQPTLRGALGGWLGLALVVAGLAGWLLGAPAAWSAPRGQRVIQPGDVATPTPTYTIILMPRPEARPKGTRLWARDQVAGRWGMLAVGRATAGAEDMCDPWGVCCVAVWRANQRLSRPPLTSNVAPVI